MIRIQSEDQLREAFREIERDQVHIPHDMLFPLAIKDYLAWMEPSGHRTYLLFNDSKGALGVIFKRAHEPPDSPVKMCEWCHSVRGGGRVGLLSVDVSKNRRVGIHLCRDLSCKDKIEGLPKANDVPSRLNREEKVSRLVEKMSTFLRGSLF